MEEIRAPKKTRTASDHIDPLQGEEIKKRTVWFSVELTVEQDATLTKLANLQKVDRSKIIQRWVTGAVEGITVPGGTVSL